MEEANPKVKQLANLLIMPVQRMPRYVLLLQSLLAKTPEWHRDKELLERGLARVEDMVVGVDGAIERQENFHKTQLIARKLGIPVDVLALDTRLYVKVCSMCLMNV